MRALFCLFSFFCGQWPEHTWRVGGLALPFCQRCTGLYLGALVATVGHAVAGRRPSPAWRWIDAALLLQMIPFGYHWLAQNGPARTVSGYLFGCGLIGFLWCGPGSGWLVVERGAARWRTWCGALLVVVGLGGVLRAVQADTPGVGVALAWGGWAGWLSLIGLGLVNLAWVVDGRVNRRPPAPCSRVP